jgi:hypothetical protein
VEFHACNDPIRKWAKTRKDSSFILIQPYKDFLALVIFMYLRYLYHTVKKNTDSLVVDSKENGIEVNTDKTQYMVMSRDQNAGRCHNIKIDNSAVERMKEFK